MPKEIKINIEDEIFEKLEYALTETGETISEIIIEFLESYIDDFEEGFEEKPEDLLPGLMGMANFDESYDETEETVSLDDKSYMDDE